MIVPLPKSQTRHPARAKAPICHTCFFDTKLYKPLPLFIFFCAYKVAQSLHENSRWGANTRSILARFGDNNWEKGEDFVKTFYVKKLVWEMEGSLSARTGWRVKWYDLVAKSKLRQDFAKVAKILLLLQKNSKTNCRSCRKNLSISFCVCLVSWKQRILEIRANIPKSCCRPVVSLLYATKSAFTAPNLCWACALASSVTFLTGDHVM